MRSYVRFSQKVAATFTSSLLYQFTINVNNAVDKTSESPLSRIYYNTTALSTLAFRITKQLNQHCSRKFQQKS